ncbi:phosphinothricin acetyltransferase [Tranquillimonas rosea]|uniref:Phosphinothricin acetyltransferase n=1 Tax=Tranquillimonas rosea TaxID=641238 RepID=A0A1H9VWH3_9RHOB|nr:GNAT family N-acetyltransferase [Tranquillimonas rosea]SES25962.1 phosphinothricin acetyltransferase [Tranquillimonas rosea]
MPASPIRSARPADVPAILSIWNPIIRDTAITFNATEKSEAEVAALISERAAAGHALLVAEGAGRVIGFGGYGQFRGGVGYGRTMEHTLLFAPEARGAGLGRAMIQALCAHARETGAHSLIAGVSAENPGGRAFHRATGFAEIATLPEVGFKFGRYMDLHLMQRML